MEQEPQQNEQAESAFPLVCELCKEKNLTETVYHATCPKCEQVFCLHFASPVDPAFCRECCIDVAMTEQIIHKKTEHYNEETDRVYTRTSKARQIQFSGLDWLFFNRRISSLSDTELLLAIEYHQTIYHGMMYERERRKVEYFHRNAGKKVVIKTSDGATVSNTETVVKKSRTIKPETRTKMETNLKALLDQLLKQGKSPQEILAMLGAK